MEETEDAEELAGIRGGGEDWDKKVFFPPAAAAAETAAAKAACWAAAACWTAVHWDNRLWLEELACEVDGLNIWEGDGGDGAMWGEDNLGEMADPPDALEDEAAAADKAAARAAPGKKPGGMGPPNCDGPPKPCIMAWGGGGRMPPPIMMALAFSAAAAAAMKLLFSASDKRGDRNKNEGSIQGDGKPKESLQKINESFLCGC